MNHELVRFLVALAFTVLMVPLGSVFWVLTKAAPMPPAEQRVHLETSLREQAARLQDDVGVDAGSSTIVMTVTMQAGVPWFPWFGLYPRQWVGWLGLAALVVAVICLLVSLYVPIGPDVRGTASVKGPRLEPKIEIKD